MKKSSENYLERIAIKNPEIKWNADENGIVTLHKENKGIANKLAQIIIRKPRVSHIHLDEFGSFVWQTIDGKKDIMAVGEDVRQHFRDKAEPLYERLAKYFQILSDFGFVIFKK